MTEVICKQVLGELRVTLQRGWSGQHRGTEVERGGEIPSMEKPGRLF